MLYVIKIQYFCTILKVYDMNDGFLYKKRVADQLIEEQLEVAGVVVVEGPKWCGKTTTAEQHAASVLYMNDPETHEENIELARINVKVLLEGATPRLIDEWQEAPQFWDAARYLVDRRNEEGQFLFTGSAVPVDRSKLQHTGTGRMAWVKMRPMSLWESGESIGSVSLGKLFEGLQESTSAKNLSLDDVAFLLCRGGWPRAISKKGKAALKYAFNYYDAVVKQEMNDVDATKRNEFFTQRIMRSYARHQGAQASVGTILADLISNDELKLNEDTIGSYLNALRKIFVIEDMPAWNPNLRSKAAIRTTDTRYYVDSSVAVASLGIGPADLVKDLKTMGLLFETMAVRDLRVYMDALDGKVYHFRDSNGLECDSVLHLRNGHYGLVEIKLGGEKLIAEGASTLNKLERKIDSEKMYSPSFKMVLTAVGNYAYLREDGVWVVPIGSLKP